MSVCLCLAFSCSSSNSCWYCSVCLLSVCLNFSYSSSSSSVCLPCFVRLSEKTKLVVCPQIFFVVCKKLKVRASESLLCSSPFSPDFYGLFYFEFNSPFSASYFKIGDRRCQASVLHPFAAAAATVVVMAVQTLVWLCCVLKSPLPSKCSPALAASFLARVVFQPLQQVFLPWSIVTCPAAGVRLCPHFFESKRLTLLLCSPP